MPRALRVCSTPRCPTLVVGGRCAECSGQAEQRRGTRQQRGYGKAHTNRFRPGVLLKHPLCQCTDQTKTSAHHHGPECLAPSTVADHWPLDKRELMAQGMDDNDPAHGRGLCKGCHDFHTSQTQPGGWNQR